MGGEGAAPRSSTQHSRQVVLPSRTAGSRGNSNSASKGGATASSERVVRTYRIEQGGRGRALHIEGWKRPLTEAKAKKELETYRTVENFWMDQFKTQCYVIV